MQTCDHFSSPGESKVDLGSVQENYVNLRVFPGSLFLMVAKSVLSQ